jgi:hypothetical protein
MVKENAAWTCRNVATPRLVPYLPIRFRLWVRGGTETYVQPD